MNAGRDADAQLASVIAAHGIPGAQLAHTRGGRTTLAAAGSAIAGGASVTDDTVFEAASLTKVVAAYLVLRRVDAGLLDLDEPLHALAPSPRTADARARRITARTVLDHTTGLPDWAGEPGDDTEPLVPAFEPGSRFGYSGEGFALLQRAVERLDGRPFADTLAAEVFAPFGMPDSSLVHVPAQAPRMIAGHDAAGRPGIPSRYLRGNAAYTLTTTARDYDAFLRRALIGGSGLSARMHALWLAPASDARGWPGAVFAPSLGWGLGVGLEERSGERWAWHWGDNGTRTAFFAASPARGESLVVFWNSAAGLRSADALLRTHLGGDRFAALDWLGAA